MSHPSKAERFPAWAQINIRDLVEQTPELYAGAFRPVEQEALYNIERQARLLRSAGRRLYFPPLYQKMLLLERAARQYYPHFWPADRIEFVAVNAVENRQTQFLLFTSREVMGILDEAEYIMSVLEPLGLAPDLRDFSEIEVKRFHQRYLRQAASPRTARAA